MVMYKIRILSDNYIVTSRRWSCVWAAGGLNRVNKRADRN